MILNKTATVSSSRISFSFSRNVLTVLFLSLVFFLLSACGDMNPHNVDVELQKSAPVEKITSYSQALLDLGLMTEIYDTGYMKVQSQDIADETGTSVTTGGEIQRNITEIMKSTLNSIGGNVLFIEYDPAYIQNQMVSGYSNFEDKVIPDVVITGGITEFDRGLETRGEGTNVDAEFDVKGVPSWFPTGTVGGSFGDTAKYGKARITLDFNLKDFQTLAGIPRMTTTNSMEVYKGLREKELAITLFGPSFGSKGTIKKVQGRHEAVRVLVQVSMMQLIGRYLAIPYWRLMGEGSEPDKIVLDSISGTYYRMSKEDRIGAVQQWLILHGYDVDITSEIDAKTRDALQKFDPAFNGDDVSEKLFTDIYISIPITRATLARRDIINKYYASLQQTQEEPAVQEAAPVVQETAPAVQEAPVQQQIAEQPVQQQAAAPAPVQEVAQAQPVQQPAPEPVKKAAPVKKKPKRFGKKLSADDW
ncbi:DUF4384 domain-containing protein [Desulfomarina sp.]